jgi:glycerol-3-phosphate dehydrogenase (NAD(P)+)
MYKIGVLGSGSWATALTKILTDNGQQVHWWVRNQESLDYIAKNHHNPHYLSAANLNINNLSLHNNVNNMMAAADIIILAVPAAYIGDVLKQIQPELFTNKYFVTAVKGILPDRNILLNELLTQDYNMPLENYFAIMGPCHAEEVANQKLSYLTLAGIDNEKTTALAKCFETSYINVGTTNDIYGVQYAAVLKNIYALGAGIAHGLDYGDNFQSVLMSNSANEMVHFLRKLNTYMEQKGGVHYSATDTPNFASSVYLGDLLVTCYSLYSRNRSFGTMIGKGYSVKAAQLEMNMVAEGYNASKCIHILNQDIGATIPIADTVYKILHDGLHQRLGFKAVEAVMS